MNVAIFVSGNGTNCENIIKHFADSDRVRIALVVSNRTDAFALERAKRHGVAAVVVDKERLNDEAVMADLLSRYAIDFIVLAGFLLMVPRFLIEHYRRRIVNIHPALLPKYGGKGMYGHHVHEAVCANHETETGITIHYVSDVCDDGEIIFQAKTAIDPNDTPADVADKVHRLEMIHYPQVIENLLSRIEST